MLYAVSAKHDPATVYITEGETSTCAVFNAYQRYEPDKWEDHLEEAGSVNELADELLATEFDCTEIYRGLAVEYFERRLDGDRNIQIIL